MPNTSIEQALKEVYALAPKDIYPLDTIEISHPSLSETLRLVQDNIEHDLTLETGQVFKFEPVPFRFIPPASGTEGFQNLTIVVDNVDRRVGDFFENVGTDSKQPVKIVYRPYLSNDKSGPQMNPPMVLSITDISINAFEIQARATFTQIINEPYPKQKYDRERFPGLGG